MKIDGASSYLGADSLSRVEENKKSELNQNDKALSTDRANQTGDEEGTHLPVDAIGQDELLGLLDRVNKYAAVQGINLQLQVDEDTEKFVIKVVDRESGDLIRQIPTEDAINLAKNIDETLKQLFSPELESEQVLSFLSDRA